MDSIVSDWAKVRTDFFEKLHKRGKSEGKPYLRFSVDENECFVAECLKDSFEWLNKKVKPEWAFVIVYNHDVKSEEEVHEHLGYRVDKSLPSKFDELKKSMFLITGVPCAHPEYLPRKSEFSEETLKTLPPLPPFAVLLNNHRAYSEEFYKEWVRFEYKNLSDQEVEIKLPEATEHNWESFLNAAIDRRREGENPATTVGSLMSGTLNAFVREYPLEKRESPSQWLSLFIPGIHIPNYPFFMNGLLVSFNRLITTNEYDALKVWTSDVCSQISVAMLLRRVHLGGAWRRLADGRELERYLKVFEHKGEGGKRLTSTLIEGSDDSQEYKDKLGFPDGGQDASTKNWWQNFLHNGVKNASDLEGWRDCHEEQLVNGIETLRTMFPSWSRFFSANLQFDDKDGGAFALWCFGRRHIKGDTKTSLHLLDLIACSYEAGWEIVIDDNQKGKWQLLHENSGWNFDTSKLTVQLLLDRLIKFPRGDKSYKTEQLLTGSPEKPVWIMDVILKGVHRRNVTSVDIADPDATRPEETGESASQLPDVNSEHLEDCVSTLYLNLLELAVKNNKLGEHQFTQMMLAASVLADDNLFIKPVWTMPLFEQSDIRPTGDDLLLNLPAKDCLEKLGGVNSDCVCWVLLGKNASRIIVRTVFE